MIIITTVLFKLKARTLDLVYFCLEGTDRNHIQMLGDDVGLKNSLNKMHLVLLVVKAEV